MTNETKASDHTCPHCDKALDSWIGPPESGWGELFVCNNDECHFFLTSNSSLIEQGAKESMGVRYAVDPMNKCRPFNLLAWMPPAVRERAKVYMEEHCS